MTDSTNSVASMSDQVFFAGKGLGAICRRADISYVLCRKPLGVYVSCESAPRLNQLIANRDARIQEKLRKEEEAAESDRQNRAKFIIQFPAASDEVIEQFYDRWSRYSSDVYNSLSAVPLNRLTQTELAELRLGQREQAGILLADEGATVIPLYRARLRREDDAATDESVHRQAMQSGFTAQRALWAINRLVKIVDSPLKSEVYSVKDQLLTHWSDYLVDGRVSRLERRYCWSCDGGGCYRCYGTGVHKERTLYEVRYRFPGDDKTYCFHTFTKPRLLTEDPGADKQVYGYRFTPEERQQLLYGFHDLLRIVRFEADRLMKAAEAKERDELNREWAAIGLPALDDNAPIHDARKCLTLVRSLSCMAG